MSTIRLPAAQAVPRRLTRQYAVIDGVRVPVAAARTCENLADPRDALTGRKDRDHTTLLSTASDAHVRAPDDAGWDVIVRARETVRAARKAQEQIRVKQRVGA